MLGETLEGPYHPQEQPGSNERCSYHDQTKAVRSGWSLLEQKHSSGLNGDTREFILEANMNALGQEA